MGNLAWPCLYLWRRLRFRIAFLHAGGSIFLSSMAGPSARAGRTMMWPSRFQQTVRRGSPVSTLSSG